MQLSLKFLEESIRHNIEFPFYIYKLNGSPGTLITPHWHEELEILCCPSDGVAELDGVPTAFKVGDIIFANKEVIHFIKSHSNGTYYAIVFDYSFLDFAQSDYCQNNIINNLKTNELQFPDKLDKNDKIYYQINNLITEIIELYFSNTFGRELKIKCNLYHMIFLFYNSSKLINGNKAEKLSNQLSLLYIKDAISYMELNYSSNITLDDLSKYAKVSRFHLIRIFKQFSGMTPIEYLVNLRIEQSITLLDSNYTITQASYNVGFNNISYFIKKFKGKYGITPREFKNSSIRTTI